MESEASEVINYLSKKMGRQYQNEKHLAENCKDDKKLLWDILSEMIRPFQPAAFRNIVVAETHSISDDLQRHRQSLPFIQNLCIIRQILTKLNIPFQLMLFIKPTAKDIISLLSKVIEYANYHRKVTTQYDARIIDLKQSQKVSSQVHTKLDNLSQERSSLQITKKQDKPMFEQREKELTDYQDQQKEMKNKNLNLSTSIAEKERFKKKSENELYLTRSQMQQKELEIIQLGKRLVQNSPEIKKELAQKQQNLADSEKKYQDIEHICEQKNQRIRNKLGGVQEIYGPTKDQQKKLEILGEQWITVKMKLENSQQKVVRQREQRQYLQRELDSKTKQDNSEYLRQIQVNQQHREITQALDQIITSLGNLQLQQAIIDKSIERFQKITLKLSAELKKAQEKGELLYRKKNDEVDALTVELREWNAEVARILTEISDPFKR